MINSFYNAKQIETKAVGFWRKNKTAEKALTFRKGKKSFYFIDGPPYASGSIHMGTALNKILKDYYVRYKKMRGFDVRYQPGYDTHGLPIAYKVQKELGLLNKAEIQKFGIDKFNKECEKFATRHVNDMANQFNKLGVWMDWKHPYLTLEQEYMENAWLTFKMIAKKGYLYKGVYPVHLCGKCSTVVSYNEIEYEKISDTSIIVKFKVTGKNEYLLIWTTTPWTLPSNTGIMVHPDFNYARVKVGNEVLIMAEKLVEDIMKIAKRTDYKIIEIVKGKKLVGIKYENPLKDVIPLQDKIKPRIVSSARYVSLEEGTGLVHSAPGHGKEDFEVGKKEGLAVVCPVRLDGTYDNSVGKYSGMYVKDADLGIIDDLEARDALFASFPIKHDYPMCWRCKNQLLQVAVPQWFLNVNAIRKKLKEENEKIFWIPDFAKKRFADWLENLGDWPITRQIYWGIPFPVWICKKCNEIKIVGSRKELPIKLRDMHMPYIDEITFKCKCGGTMQREKEVFDVWFDSAVCSWASLNYPKENKLFKKIWPPQINIEARDQIRGWWNSQLITSIFAFGKKPYEAILMHGFVLDIGGKKLSKSAGAATPEEMVDKYGVDMLRLYLTSSTPGMDFFVDESKLEELKKFFNIFWNVHLFIKTYCKSNGSNANLQLEDKWILSRVNTIIKEVTKYNDLYYANKSTQGLMDFVLEDFSRWYIRLIRKRVKPSYNESDKEGAYYTLNYVMNKLLKAFAIVIPHTTEVMHASKESIHLQDWPAADERLINIELEKNMKVVQEVNEVQSNLRQQLNLKLRHPLKKITISGNTRVEKAMKALNEIMKVVFNAKEVRFEKLDLQVEIKPNYKVFGPAFGKDVNAVLKLAAKENPKKLKEKLEKGKVKLSSFVIEKEMFDIKEKLPSGVVGKTFTNGFLYVDTEMSSELLEESLVNELSRVVHLMRKEAGKNVDEKIELYLKGSDDVLQKWKAQIEKLTSARITIGRLRGKNRKQVEFKNYVVEVAF